VTDTPVHQVKVFNLQGQLLNSIGQFGEGVADLNYPTHLAINDGELYVSDTLNARIQVYSTQSGKHLRQLGKRGLFVGDLVRPKGVAADSEHNIYIIESNHDHLLVYNRKGEFLMPIRGGGGGNFYLPSGVWVDFKNRVFVADTLNNRVAVFQFLGGAKGNANE
jgi:DNA-binding beta-propeller fold protein YncE